MDYAVGRPARSAAQHVAESSSRCAQNAAEAMHMHGAWQPSRWVMRLFHLTAGLRHPAVQPFGTGLLCALPQFQGDHANTMLWGTYRPGLYLGECGSCR